MIPTNYTYPLDTTGSSTDNLVPTETHTITPVNGTDFRFIVPKAAPYFVESMTVIHASTGAELTRGQDWVPGHVFDAVKNYPPYINVHGSIVILNNNLSGSFLLEDYQTIGGEFVVDEVTLLEILANKVVDPRTVSWEDVTDKPLVMDPTAHLHHAADTLGYDALVAAVQELVTKFVLENSKLALAISQHVGEKGNVHGLNLTHLGIDRFSNTYRAELTELIAGDENTNFITPDNFRRAVDIAIAQLNLIGAEGDIPFMDGSGQNFGVSMGPMVENVAVVTDSVELAAQLSHRESFEDVYNNWRRIAMKDNVVVSDQTELDVWDYNGTTDKIQCTINSSTLVGLMDPYTVSGDFVFEVELSSTSSDDDWIGVVLGMESYDNKMRNLVVERSASNTTTNPTALPSVRLVYDRSGSGNTVLAEIADIGSAPGGWAGYTGVVKMRVRRIGSVIYITTTEPDGAYLSEVQYDLNDRIETRIFMGDATLGYCAFSQANASWKTIRRTGANPLIAAMHEDKVYNWNGTGYAADPRKVYEVVIRGRMYRNNLTDTVWYAPSSGSILPMHRSAARKPASGSTRTKDTVVYIDESNVSQAGQRVNLLKDNGNGTTTLLGAVGCDAADQLTFYDASGVALAGFNGSGKLEHWGTDHKSDIRLKKNLVKEFEYRLGLNYYHWIWAEHEQVPERLWGTAGHGVIAQEVVDHFPEFVTENAEGYLAVDETKLALRLAMENEAKPGFIKLVKRVLKLFKK